MKSPKSLLNAIWTRSPRENYRSGRRKIRRTLGRGDHGWDYSLEAVVNSPKHASVQFELDRWERQWRVIGLNGFRSLEANFDFAEKNVLELGCGPVLGYGPIALFRGAKKFWFQEPDLLRPVLESAELKSEYFRPLFQELTANYGTIRKFDDWYAMVMDSSIPYSNNIQNEVDITISNSVLEHIPRKDLPSVLDDLQRASRLGAWFFHTVDFGPHGGTLSDLYSRDWRTEFPHLNLLRKSDIQSLLSISGTEVIATIVYKAGDYDETILHETWKRYTSDDLASRVVYFVGQKLHNNPEAARTRVSLQYFH